MADFDGKIALVTGGGTGIGRATAIAFAREGASVVIGNRNSKAGEAVVKAIQDNGGQASFLRTDVSSEEDVKALIEHAVATYGRLDVAFNNAGIGGAAGPLADQTSDNFDAIMGINVKGVWMSMKYEIREMLKTGGGAIVNNSSVGGLVGFASVGIYSASKHAVMGLTKSAALEYSAHGVRVNAVNPAVIRTPMAEGLAKMRKGKPDDFAAMHPIGRIGEPEEVAEAVLWLCSDKASFVTGTAMCVDGGFTVQ
ncbi:MAG: SDR family oxidoreductase [Gammaproteobacteria bacterium]|nr:SDR family oxidoreductase [Gammaproteobacteria bacterium]MDH3578480.1 SDR family oxidoreductase [Gammaproteobacteria bacterium]